MIQRNQDLKTRFDIVLFGLVATLAAVSIALLYSISNAPLESEYWKKQLFGYGVGIGAMVGVTLVPRRFWFQTSYLLWGILQIPLLFVSASAKGAERWLAIGGFHFQPSEFAKLGVLLALARLFSDRKVGLNNLKPAVVPFLFFFIPFILILKQPNLSTALSLATVFVVLLFWSGFTILELLILASPLISVGLSFHFTAWAIYNILAWLLLFQRWYSRKLSGKVATFFLFAILLSGLTSQVVWSQILKPHQRSRILTFLEPARDPGGAGYQVLQSQVAIGSGGLWGKGFGQGSQSNLQFLPEEHNDFIFAVLAEQFGFIGCFVVLGLLLAFLIRCLQMCFEESDRFRILVIVGAVTIFSFHTLVNVAMTLGLMPVTGLPLPFLSYGGSFVITCMMLVGFLLHMRLGEDD
ncbi:MAG: rod shape-determining protein RodA [Fibrobacterota bacterium]|nr:rod shape-determining protein RodA [Fibrobacterota bacterium]QQS05287.1 MAG: rod shape-determining protein RodA [Fibrobacterota bacterium]